MIHWTQACQKETLCPQCATLAEERTVLKVRYGLAEGDVGDALFSCPKCGFRARESFEIPVAPKPAVIIPTRQEVKTLSERPAPKPSSLSIPKPPSEPMEFDDLREFLTANMPPTIDVRGLKLDFRTDRRSLATGKGTADLGVEASYWLIVGGRAEKICHEIAWCNDGEPDINRLTNYLIGNAEGNLLPDSPIRKVVSKPPRQGIAIEVTGTPVVGERFSRQVGPVSTGASLQPSLESQPTPSGIRDLRR